MKKINIKLIGVFLFMVLVLGGCKKWVDTDVNTSPDYPKDVPMYTLLATVEASMGYNTIGGTDVCMVSSIWMQQLHGIARQGASEGIYIWRDGDVNNQWNTNYTTTMINLYTLIQKAKDAKSPGYLGVGEVLMANSLGITSDTWGDIPYSEAFQGLTNLTPKFDTQQEIYTSIMSLLDDAIVQLSTPGIADVPQQDLIYNGDPAQWLKAAYALKARYTLHLSKRDPNAWANALPLLDKAFTSNADNMQMPFNSNVGQQNPFFQFMDQRGDASMDSVFVYNMWNIRHDPRIAAFAAPNGAGDYVGASWAYSGEDVSAPGPAFASPDSPVKFITYVECLLIKAECEQKAGNDGQAQKDLVAALTASMAENGISGPAVDFYITAYDSATAQVTGTPLYKEILTQKWLSLVYQEEVFNDWRRTDNVIGLQPNPNAVLSTIPRRFPYSTDEKAYNPNTPQTGATLTDRVWWDSGDKK